MKLFEWVALLVSAGLFVSYFLWLAYVLRHKSLHTVVGISEIRRSEWVQSVIEERRDILAVQTLRNWSTAASFLATTAILIATGVLHFLITVPQQPEMLNQLNFLGSTNPTLVTAKLFAIVTALLAAFFNFAVAIRYYNHVSIEINVPRQQQGEQGIEGVSRLMDRGGIHYTVGMRCFYLVIPLALWLFGPSWLLLGSISLTVALYMMDRLD